jgi:hypothetical protein
VFNERILEFEEEVARRRSLRLRDHQSGLQAVLLDALPYKILQKQKRYMRRHMRKPNNMKVRTYASHLAKINNEELPELPPFAPRQSLNRDDMVDIILNGIPNSRTTQELIQFCERMESAEERSDTGNNQSNNSQNGSRKKSKTGNSGTSSKKSTGKWCSFHETDTHDTSECRQKKFHGNNEDGTPKKTEKSNSGSNNKHYKKGQYVPRKEVNAIVKQAVQAVRKELKKEDTKKRSAEEANLVESKTVATIPKHKFVWNQPLNEGDIVEDDKSAMEASNSMSDMDNQLHEAFDQGEDSSEYSVQQEQFLLETAGKQA